MMLRVEVRGEHEGGKEYYLRSKANKLGLIATKNLLKCFPVVWLPASSMSNFQPQSCRIVTGNNPKNGLKAACKPICDGSNPSVMVHIQLWSNCSTT